MSNHNRSLPRPTARELGIFRQFPPIPATCSWCASWNDPFYRRGFARFVSLIILLNVFPSRKILLSFWRILLLVFGLSLAVAITLINFHYISFRVIIFSLLIAVVVFV